MRKERNMRQLMKGEIIKDIMTYNYLNIGSLTTNLRGFYFSFSLYFVSHLIKNNFHDTFNFYKPEYLSRILLQLTQSSLKFTHCCNMKAFSLKITNQ